MKDSLGAIGDRSIAVDFPLRQFVEIADALGDSDVGGFDSPRRIIGHAVEHDQPGYLFRKRAGIGQADHAAHGVANVPVVVVEPASAFGAGSAKNPRGTGCYALHGADAASPPLRVTPPRAGPGSTAAPSLRHGAASAVKGRKSLNPRLRRFVWPV
jgi:hypothetical protein